jgi:Chitobiase/beta-hexosaminidase C-terminal domain
LSSYLARTHVARRRTRAFISAAGAIVAAAALAAPAGAAVSSTNIIAVLPDSSGMELTYPTAPNTPLTVSLSRGGILLSTATATTDASGAAAVNGGTANCWTGVTPDILPGDVVEVIGGGFDDTSVVQAVTSSRPVQTAPDTVVVHGTAPGRPPASQLEARIIGSSAAPFDANAKRVLRAAVGQPYVIDYDGPTGDAWTATYPRLSPADVDRALHAIDARGVVVPNLSELTISQNPVVRGPQPPCTAPLLRDAATSSIPSAVNIASAGKNLVVSGVSQDAGAVSVSLDDEDPATAPITATAAPSPSTGNQTWSVTIPAGQVSGLTDGTLTASTTFTTLAGPLGGGSLSILKDLSAPAAPTATPSPAGGPFQTAQSVTLSDADTSAAIHWTNDGSTPSASSPVLAHGAAISVTSSQTIEAVAIDPAGNAGPVATFAYTMAKPTPAGGGGGGPSTTTIIQQIPLFLPVAPSQRVLATASRPLAVHGLSVAVLSGHAVRIAMRLDRGTGVVRFRLYRARNGRRTGGALMTAVRLPASDGRYVVTLRSRALRALRSGKYVLEAQAATSGTSFGAPSRKVVTVR